MKVKYIFVTVAALVAAIVLAVFVRADQPQPYTVVYGQDQVGSIIQLRDGLVCVFSNSGSVSCACPCGEECNSGILANTNSRVIQTSTSVYFATTATSFPGKIVTPDLTVTVTPMQQKSTPTLLPTQVVQPTAVVYCNQGRGNGSEGCDPGNSNHIHQSNDENGQKPGDHGGRK